MRYEVQSNPMVTEMGETKYLTVTRCKTAAEALRVRAVLGGVVRITRA
jgi:hypothetical protein